MFRVPLKGEQIILATDRVFIRQYVGDGYKTWYLTNGEVLINPLYH